MKDNLRIERLIKMRIAAISDHLLKQNPAKDISLYTGDSGLALYFAQMYLTTGNLVYKDRVNCFIESLHTTLESRCNIETSFCSGIAGFGWLMCFLNRYAVIKLPSNYFYDIDNILFEQMILQANNLRFDQLHESVSIARYFINRNNRTALSFMVNALYNTCDNSNNETKWISYINGGDPTYDFGLAHGMAGILYFLSKCYMISIKKEKCMRLIKGIIAFYKHNEMHLDFNHSYFPNNINVNEYNNHISDTHFAAKRNAWCYGDLGVLYTILYSGSIIKDIDMIKYAIDKLRMVVPRKLSDVHNENSFLCHGLSGSCHILTKIKLLSNNTIVNETQHISLYEYLISTESTSDNNNNNLMTGLSGIALSYISYVYKKNNQWDECIMLS